MQIWHYERRIPMIEREKSLREIRKAAEKYFKLEKQVEEYLKWKEVDDETTDEQWMQSHIDSLREQASELELKIKNRNEIFETIEKLWGIEYHYSTLLWMLLQVLKDMNNISKSNK
jgi:hypothetical protein